MYFLYRQTGLLCLCGQIAVSRYLVRGLRRFVARDYSGLLGTIVFCHTYPSIVCLPSELGVVALVLRDMPA